MLFIISECQLEKNILQHYFTSIAHYIWNLALQMQFAHVYTHPTILIHWLPRQMAENE